MTTNKGNGDLANSLLGKEVAGVKVYTVNETAQLLEITPQTVRAYIKSGRLNARRVGQNYLITEKDIYKLITTPQ